mgnify:CR=1 FL=1
MLDWNTPKLSDKEWIEKCVKESQYIGSDAAFANIYLLRSKYNIKVTYYKDLLIRYYEGLGNRKGYTFPLGRKDVLSALYAIEQDAKQMTTKSTTFLASSFSIRCRRCVSTVLADTHSS